VRPQHRANLKAWKTRVGWVLAVLVVAITIPGCSPGGRSRESEENDPNIRQGEAYRRDAQFPEAEQAFLKALRGRPDSAAAHWQLGILYFEELKDWPGALYHFDRYAKLRSKSRPDLIKQLTDACKQELAKQVPLGNISLQMQREITDLLRTNAALRHEIDQLRQRTQSTRPVQSEPAPVAVTTNPAPSVITPPTGPAESPSPVLRNQVGRRTHTIRPGETMASVARAHGLSLDSVVSANPSLNPRRLKPGQVIQLPNP
jgi:LysM repeat protein